MRLLRVFLFAAFAEKVFRKQDYIIDKKWFLYYCINMRYTQRNCISMNRNQPYGGNYVGEKRTKDSRSCGHFCSKKTCQEQKEADYRFFCVRYKSIEIAEATVQYLFEDDESKKTYLVFNTALRPREYILREYEGAPDDQIFRRVGDAGIQREVYELLHRLQGDRQDRSGSGKIVLCV